MSIRKRTYCILTLMAVLMVFSASISSFASSNGTERAFGQDELPNDYGNVYYSAKAKESDFTTGYVRCSSISSGCSGINAWFCYSNHNRKSNIVFVGTTNVNKTVIYSEGYYTGSLTALGIEDADNTYSVKHKVSGYVNYR